MLRSRRLPPVRIVLLAAVRDGGSEHPGWVGLEFVPLDGREEPDVRGVLWLDRATAELRYVEYTYTGLGFRGPVDWLGGRIDFRRVPSGTWIIPFWTVRAPLLQWKMTGLPFGLPDISQ